MKNRPKAPRGPRSLTQTLTLSFFVVSVVALLIAGGLLFFANVQAQQQAIASQQQLISAEAAKTVSSSIQEKFSVLRTAARITNPKGDAPDQVVSVLQTLLGLQPAFRQVVFLDTKSVQIAKASRLAEEASSSLMSHLVGQPLSQVSQGKDYIGSVYVDPETNEPLAVMAIPVNSVYGEWQGTLAAELNLKFMWDLVDQIRVGKSGVAYVVDRQGSLLAYADVGRVLRGENIANLAEVNEFIKNEATTDQAAGRISTGIRGNTVVSSHVPLGTPDWAVITELPWEEAYQGVVQTALTSLAILLVMGALASLGGYVLSRRLAAPVVDLTATASRISTGEVGLQATVRGTSEVVRLAEAFNSMTGQLRSLIEGLEKRVAERTAALAERTAKLAEHSATLEKYSNYMVALQDTTVELVRHMDVNELLQATVARSGALVGTEHGYVFLLDPSNDAMEMRVGIGTYRNLVGTHAKMGAGLAGTVWQTGEQLAVADYQNWSGRLGGSDRSQLHSVAGVPLQLHNRVVGVLGLAYLEPGRVFGPNEMEILGRFAQLASIALDNVNLYQEQAKLAEENRKLLEQAQQASEENRRLFERAQQASEENRRLFERAQQTTEELNTLTRQLTRTGWEEYQARQQSDLVGEAMRDDWKSGSGHPPAAEQALQAGDIVTLRQNGRVSLAVPIVVRGYVLGVIGLEEREMEREWSGDEVAAVKDVAEHVGLALENARLFDETQLALATTRRMAEREKQISAIGEHMYASTDVQTVLQIAAAELVQLTGRGRAVVWVPPQKN